MYSVGGTAALPAVGFPIRTSSDQSLVSGSPGLFAATHVLLRLLSPRHPSCALCSLVILSSSSIIPDSKAKDLARARRGLFRLAFPTIHLPTCAYAVLKERRRAAGLSKPDTKSTKLRRL